MNTRTDKVTSLRLPVSFGAARRNKIDGKPVLPDALVHFNALLRTLYRHADSVTADSLVSLVRELRAKPAEEMSSMISERIACAEKLRSMLKDQNWPLDSNLRVRARLLLAYLDKHDDLIPDSQASIGHLDDALMIELSWPRFENVVNAYQEYCHYRETTPVLNSYADWQDALNRKSNSRLYANQSYPYAYATLMNTALFRVR
jgi:uncharacterized membrane protein YkvA (DUF1232 family)